MLGRGIPGGIPEATDDDADLTAGGLAAIVYVVDRFDRWPRREGTSESGDSSGPFATGHVRLLSWGPQQLCT